MGYSDRADGVSGDRYNSTLVSCFDLLPNAGVIE